MRKCTLCEREFTPPPSHPGRGRCGSCRSRRHRLLNPDNARRRMADRRRRMKLLPQPPTSCADCDCEYRPPPSDHSRPRCSPCEYKKRRQNIGTMLGVNLRNRVNGAIRGRYRGGSAVRDLGCSIPDFLIFIAERFLPGMTWDNWGEWHLDHRVPLSAFDLTDRDQFLSACHFSNYQPLWAVDNLSKGSRLAA